MLDDLNQRRWIGPHSEFFNPQRNDSTEWPRPFSTCHDITPLNLEKAARMQELAALNKDVPWPQFLRFVAGFVLVWLTLFFGGMYICSSIAY